MNKKYRAMQIVAPGVLEMTERPIPAPGPDEVLIKIKACGVCGADLRDAESAPQEGQPGRIPGHEIVGFIARKGEKVPDIWQIGQRVGVGRLGGYCQYCKPCRSGLFHLCENQLTPGLSCDGGYAEYTAADSKTVAALLSALSPRGKTILLGTGQTPLQVSPGMMIGAERTLTGSFVSTPEQTERALRFSQLFQTLPITELLPFERANEALNRLKQGMARYRIVLTMNQDN